MRLAGIAEGILVLELFAGNEDVANIIMNESRRVDGVNSVENGMTTSLRNANMPSPKMARSLTMDSVSLLSHSA